MAKAAKAKTKSKAKAKSTKSSGGESKSLRAKKRNLVIVESPAKASTIKKFLGNDFFVKASVGHVRDLPKRTLGVTIDDNFHPDYEVLAEKADIVKELEQAAAKANVIYLAPDPDREGEAIAWHIHELLTGTGKEIKRIEFNEITKQAVQDAIQNPREIDTNRVNAQQARRVLDRLVGYKLSPLLWKKVTKGLSAGRVQSVAVRLICEREEEILAFVPEEYWTIHTELSAKKKPDATLKADVVKVNGEKAKIGNEDESNAIVKTLNGHEIQVSQVKERTTTRNPLAPFITSTLQREASNRFGFTVKRTMQIAQKLYEGMETGSGETEGLITYMRTDSTRISEEAQAEAKEFIVNTYGKDHYPEETRNYESKRKKKGNVQDAHEAIRPTSVLKTPESVQKYLQPDQYKIYKLIWDRFVASQMEGAKIKIKSIEMEADNVMLRASHSKVIFKGYMALYRTEQDDEAEAGNALPDLEKGDVMLLKKVEPKQHFTEPPPRFTEAALVKTMEELGIGRPSTYAPTISTIQDRGYILKEEKSLKPTEIGKAVNNLLVQHFGDVVDVSFTADLEDKLDTIESDGTGWQSIVGDFYFPFEKELADADKNVEKVVVLFEGAECPECKSPMQIKNSRWGSQFLGCTQYPDCKGTAQLTKDQQIAPEERESEEKCTECKSDKFMLIKYGRFGEYLACANEDCKATRKFVVKTGITCPQCNDKELVQRKSRYGKFFYGCGGYPECKFAVWAKPTGRKCPDCESLTVEKHLKKGDFEACSSKECKWSIPLEQSETAEATSS